jgi:hypothetical protein
MIAEIERRRFYIGLENCSKLIIDKPIQGLKVKFDNDIDGSMCIIVCEAECDVGARGWYKTYVSGTSAHIATPSILFPYVGKKVVQYQSHLEVRKGELFRIRPFDFSFTNNKTIKHAFWPYFTKGETLVFPSKWMLSNGIQPDATPFVSFDMNSYDSIGNGKITAELSYERTNNLQFRLLSMIPRRTRRLTSLSKLVGECGKQMSRYVYESFVKDDIHKYGLLTFKEYDDQGSIGHLPSVRRTVERNRLDRDHVAKSKKSIGRHQEGDEFARLGRIVRYRNHFPRF